ncbi:MAG TPA: hypothetical protein VL119_13365 [Acidimicrobiia bacterium]|nr:hypothetical protein [Acidimicrobiia bacterium]
MDVTSATSATSWASLVNTPAAQLMQAQSVTDSSLFAGATGEPSDLVSLTSAATAMPLYQVPGLLTGLTQWDGSQTPGSERAPAPADPAAAAITPTYSFNPFDEGSWDTSGQTSTTTPASTADGSTSGASTDTTTTEGVNADGTGIETGTGVVVPLPAYSFNPFDASSWDVQPPTGNTIDTLA